jgi:mono/diheme cytochrome c family protein
MARSDLEAIVAYLRSLEPASNPLPRDQIVPVEELPVIEYRGPATPPDNSNPNARGSYLVNAVMACTDCHTPLDQTTGAPNFDMFLAGGQPYEGPWGIVYSANITPHEETGIGSWTNEEVERVFRSGVRIDGRVLVLMPWVEYSVITDEDLDALITYIRQDIAPVDNEVPAPALEAAFIQYVELPVEEADDPAAGAGSNTNLLIGLGVVLVLGLGVGLYMGFRGGKSAEG